MDGLFYAFGGRIDGSYARNLAVTEAYDPVADRWEQDGPMPTARSGIAAAVLDARILVVGGEAPNGTFDKVEGYDAKSNSWSSFARMPTARHGVGAIALGRKLYVISGGPRPGASASAVRDFGVLKHLNWIRLARSDRGSSAE
jgi:N-acetylneuraminic acid mutarotase